MKELLTVQWDAINILHIKINRFGKACILLIRLWYYAFLNGYGTLKQVWTKFLYKILWN